MPITTDKRGVLLADVEAEAQARTEAATLANAVNTTYKAAFAAHVSDAVLGKAEVIYDALLTVGGAQFRKVLDKAKANAQTWTSEAQAAIKAAGGGSGGGGGGGSGEGSGSGGGGGSGSGGGGGGGLPGEGGDAGLEAEAQAGEMEQPEIDWGDQGEGEGESAEQALEQNDSETGTFDAANMLQDAGVVPEFSEEDVVPTESLTWTAPATDDVVGMDIFGATKKQKTVFSPFFHWETIKDPTSVTVSRRNNPKSDVFDAPSSVFVSGGNRWVPSWNKSDTNWDQNPTKVVIVRKDGSRQTYNDASYVAVRGGQMVASTYLEGDIIGSDYTDAFFAAKQAVDNVLLKADSITNAVQHASVMPYFDQEAKIVEGFRRGVETKDRKLVDSATAAMKQLAAIARQFFINPATGEVKSQTKEAATQLLVEAGDDIEKFKKDVGDTMSWLKWAALVVAGVIVLGVGGYFILPIFLRSRARMF